MASIELEKKLDMKLDDIIKATKKDGTQKKIKRGKIIAGNTGIRNQNKRTSPIKAKQESAGLRGVSNAITKRNAAQVRQRALNRFTRKAAVKKSDGTSRALKTAITDAVNQPKKQAQKNDNFKISFQNTANAKNLQKRSTVKNTNVIPTGNQATQFRIRASTNAGKVNRSVMVQQKRNAPVKEEKQVGAPAATLNERFSTITTTQRPTQRPAQKTTFVTNNNNSRTFRDNSSERGRGRGAGGRGRGRGGRGRGRGRRDYFQ